MADYASTSITVKYGEQSDYSDNIINRTVSQSSITATKPLGPFFETANSTGITLTTSGIFTTIEQATFYNKGSVAVEIRFTSLAPVTGSTANKVLLPALATMTIPSITPSGNIVLITSSSTSEVEVLLYGT